MNDIPACDREREMRRAVGETAQRLVRAGVFPSQESAEARIKRAVKVGDQKRQEGK